MSNEAADAAMISVEVVYGLPQQQWRVAVQLPSHSTVATAIERSGLRQQIDTLQVDDESVGIHSRPVRLDTVLRDGDRVEIYRPLRCDPKEIRRQRAAASKPTRR